MKIVYTGLESAGKSLAIADIFLQLLVRNQYWKKKYGFTRRIFSNLRLHPQLYERFKEFIVYFDDYQVLLNETGIDVIWDEISSDLSALKKEPLPRVVNRWLRQGAKQGVCIYATAQEFHDIHLDFRRRVMICYHVKKILGSSRGGDNMPPVRLIWGLCLAWQLCINPYNELRPERLSVWPKWIFFGKGLCQVFDTHQVIKGADELPFEHVEKVCNTCGYKKILHR